MFKTFLSWNITSYFTGGLLFENGILRIYFIFYLHNCSWSFVYRISVIILTPFISHIRCTGLCYIKGACLCTHAISFFLGGIVYKWDLAIFNKYQIHHFYYISSCCIVYLCLMWQFMYSRCMYIIKKVNSGLSYCIHDTL